MDTRPRTWMKKKKKPLYKIWKENKLLETAAATEEESHWTNKSARMMIIPRVSTSLLFRNMRIRCKLQIPIVHQPAAAASAVVLICQQRTSTTAVEGSSTWQKQPVNNISLVRDLFFFFSSCCCCRSPCVPLRIYPRNVYSAIHNLIDLLSVNATFILHFSTIYRAL